jgi:hypothetical protein
MARGERNARHDDRNPGVDPYFGPEVYRPAIGYQRGDPRDFTGFSTQDDQLPARLGELAIDPEVKAPLGGAVVGRLSVASYGNAEGPAAVSYFSGLDPYPLYGFPCQPMGLPPGACSTRERLGIPESGQPTSIGTDDTGFAGVGSGPLFLGAQHAMARAPLLGPTDDAVGERGSGAAYDGVVPEHVLSRIRGYANAGIYDGGDEQGWGEYRSAPIARLGDSIDGSGYPRIVSQLDERGTGEDGPGFVGGGDYGNVSPSEELANLRRVNDSGDEYAGDGWGERTPVSYDRRANRNSDYDR